MSNLPVDGVGSQILLPFAEREWISIPRTCSILGVSKNVVYDLRRNHYPDGRPLINLLHFGRSMRFRVHYRSVVEYCDYLSEKFAIPSRRKPIDNPILRHRDEDLLPFPLSDTMGVSDAKIYLGYDSHAPVLNLIESGAFEAYRLYRQSPWRISRSSFTAWYLKTRNGEKNIPSF
jgi:hypothetical protein